MEASAGKPNPRATPLDKATKEELRSQIEQTIAEKKEVAKSGEKGQWVLPDLSKTLGDPTVNGLGLTSTAPLTTRSGTG